MMALHPTYCFIHRLCLILWLLAGLIMPAWAQVPTTITADGSLGTTVTRDGNIFDITDGTQQGRNLFHSFDRFDVGTGDIARFTGPTSIDNILSRVTGGQQSLIDGTLQSNIAGANLYLLNPSGVIFGPNATLDMRGSFHVSTADVLRFDDGSTFSADLERQSMLTVAAPAAFGFLQAQPANITVDRSHLEVPEGETLSVVGGDIDIIGNGEDAVIPTVSNPFGVPNLGAPAGRLCFVSVGSSGNVVISSSGPSPSIQVENFERLGKMTMSDRALVSTSSDSGGTIAIRGENLQVDGSRIFVDTLGDIGGASIGVDIQIQEGMALLNGTLITTDVAGSGHAGDIVISARSLNVSNGVLGSRAFNGSTGDTGAVVITAESVQVTQGGQIESMTFPGSSGASGGVSVVVDRLEVLNGFIRSTTSGDGNAGDVELSVGELTISEGGQISGSTSGPGQGGKITIRGAETITLHGTNNPERFPSGIFAQSNGQGINAGAAGAIIVDTDTITTTKGAQITSLTRGPGQGGSITIRATSSVILDGVSEAGRFRSGFFASTESDSARAGTAGMVVVEAPSIELTGGAQIASLTHGPGMGGAVTIRASETLTLDGSSQDDFASGIATVAIHGSSGDAGSVLVEARSIKLLRGAQINSNTFGPGNGGTIVIRARGMVTVDGTSDGSDGVLFPSAIGVDAATSNAGNAGSVRVEADSVTVTGGGLIRSSTFGPGQGGNVTVHATNTVTLTGSSPDGQNPSSIGANTERNGKGGEVFVIARHVQLNENVRISATSNGIGNAGNIHLTASERLLMARGSAVTTFSVQADGGNIVVIAQDEIRMQGSEITTAVRSGQGRGGNITVDSRSIVLQNSQLSANAFGGPGGNIQIAADVLLTNPDSIISASSALGIDGEIDIRALIADLSNTVTPLQQPFAAAVLLQSHCAERIRGKGIASFVVAGRDQIPPKPGDSFPSPLILAHTSVRQSAWPRPQGHHSPSFATAVMPPLNRACVQ